MATCAHLRTSTPIASVSLKPLHASIPPAKKRKVFDITKAKEDTSTFHEFTIYPCQTSLANGPQALAPIARFSRTFLPLSWLNGCPSQTQKIPPGSLFHASISCLETGLHCDKESIVLGVRLRITGNDGADGGLYVVEGVKRGIYSITPLHSWVRIDDLLNISQKWHNGDADSQLDAGLALIPDGLAIDWLERAMVTGFTRPSNGEQLNTRSSITGTGEADSASRRPEDGVGKPLARSMVATAKSGLFEGDQTATKPTVREEAISDMSVGTTQLDLSAAPQDLEGMLDSLRTQYLETLYISKTSVAYFAKGPLSRARAAFRSNPEDSTPQPITLYNFLNDSIMSVKKMDSKYRETLPKMAREISRDIFGTEGVTPEKSKPKRKSKRYKLGRNGMYSDEKDFVSKWCEGTIQTEESPQQSALPDLARLIGELRLREMQLQILLVLEALALEESPGVKTQVEESKEPKKKKNKRQELNTTFELLIDRLCIWHTVASNDMLSDSIPYGREEKHQSEKPTTNDKLRDFCTEVIMPFYSSRLPDQCQTINRKFGGPTLNSPVRKNGATTENLNHGSEKKTASQKSRRTLKRVRTDEQVSTTSKVPTFSRANTAPSIKTTSEPRPKPGPRELTSTLSSSVLGDRGRIRKAKRIDNREVDLDAVAKQHEAKLEKVKFLMDQKRELDAAINALKKPNREVVSREFVDSAEKRSSWAHRSRKSKNPTRIPPRQSVQVMATPKGPRTKDCSAGASGGPFSSSLPSQWQRAKEAPRQSGTMDVQGVDSVDEMQFVQDTPLKPTARDFSGSSGFEGRSRGASSKSAPDIVAATPQRPRTVLDVIHEESQSPLALSRPIPNTPRSKKGSASTSTTTIQETPPRKRQMPIYHNFAPSHAEQEADYNSSAIPCTPVKNQHTTTTTTVADSVLRPSGSIGARAVYSTPIKSNYDYMDWDASDDNHDDDDEDELAF